MTRENNGNSKTKHLELDTILQKPWLSMLIPTVRKILDTQTVLFYEKMNDEKKEILRGGWWINPLS